MWTRVDKLTPEETIAYFEELSGRVFLKFSSETWLFSIAELLVKPNHQELTFRIGKAG